MLAEHHGWFSPRLGRGMGLEVWGHFGPPVLVFPASGGGEGELATHGGIDALAPLLEAGRLKLFCADSVEGESWCNTFVSPRERSFMQAMYDAYLVLELAPFIQAHCRTPGIPITTLGASFGAYHALNSLLKHPQLFGRCLALSGAYDMSGFMDGEYDENLYFNNPVDYITGLSDPWYLERLADCEIRLVTGQGPGEDPAPTYQMSHLLASRGIRHQLDDWGAEGGHDWPFWTRQMAEYLGRL
jgi:esterase/lipase superfamily enzyme